VGARRWERTVDASSQGPFTSALPERWAATPIVPKPATAETIIGAIKFVLSPGDRDIIVRLQRSDSRNFGQLEQAISQDEERIMCERRCIERLANTGADTSADERVMATITEVIANMRAHR